MELVFEIKLVKIAKMRVLLSLLEMLLGVSGSVSTFHVLQSSSTMVALFLLQVLEMYMQLQTLWRNRTLGPVWFLLFTKKKKKNRYREQFLKTEGTLFWCSLENVLVI